MTFAFRPTYRRLVALHKLFRPSVYGLDALDNLYAVHSTARVLTSWTGRIVRLRRSGDNAEADFGPTFGTGFLSSVAIGAWAQGGTAFVTTLYDQSGNSRDAAQLYWSDQPTLSLAGAFPVLQFDGGDNLIVASALGFARNIGEVSLIAAVKYADANQAAVSASNGTSSTQTRCSISKAPTGGVFRAGGRRLDANGNQTTTGIAGDLNWHIQIGRFDYTNSNLYHRIDASTESNTSFQTDGVTSDTDSMANAVVVGGLGSTLLGSGAQMSLAVFVRDLLTDSEDSSLATSLAALKL